MKNILLLLALFSINMYAQIDFEAHIIVESHPDVSGPYSLVSADIDGDNDKDLVATSTNGDTVVWFENLDGQGNFSEPKTLISDMDSPKDIAVADIDGDGDLDIIAVSTRDFKIVWFENTDGLGLFSPQKLIITSSSVQNIKAEDIDGDGDIDIVSGGFNIFWLENTDGLGNFASEKIISDNEAFTEAIAISDIDGDGDMDVTVADDYNEEIVWYENTDSQGAFGSAKTIANGAFGAVTIATNDLDNDGDLEVVSNYGEIAWFENTDGLGNFSTPNIIDPNLGFAYKLYVEDLEGDGNNDIIASLFDRGEVIWLKNDGNGNFGEAQVIYSDEFVPIAVIADDFNGDGRMDVAASSYLSDQIIWFENKGPLGIYENTTNLFSLYPNPTNGLLNINSTLTISEISVYNNLGQLLFASEKTNHVDISALSEGIYFVKIKDENGQSETKKIIKE